MFLRKDFDPINGGLFSSCVRPKKTSTAWYVYDNPLSYLAERPTKEVIFEDNKDIHYKLEDGSMLKVKKKARRTKKNTPDLYGIKGVDRTYGTTIAESGRKQQFMSDLKDAFDGV